MEYGNSTFAPQTLNLFHTLLLLLVVVLIFCTPASGLGQESTSVRRVIGPSVYDKLDTFSSKCGSDEVVLVDLAVLDRGTGCPDETECLSEDITVRLDGMCSAQLNCSVPVRNLCNGTCSATSEPSLNITYSCLRVVPRDCRLRCPPDGASRLTAAEGFLTSETTLDKRCGTPDCPWRIQVPPGQNIEIVLYDFSSAGRQGQTQRGQRTQGETSCVVVRERANPKEVRECAAGRTRKRILYTTVSNTVELQLIPKQEKFILHYRAIGCPDITAPYNSRVKRTGDKCEIDCPGSDLRWTLTCEGNEWNRTDRLEKCPGEFYAPGSLPSPQATGSESETGSGSSSSSLPTSILIAAVVAVTVIIAVLVSTVGFVCLKKHQYETKLGDPLLYGAPASEFEFCADFAPVRPGVAPKAGAATTRSLELLDDQLSMQPLHRPLPTIPCADGRTGSWRPNDPRKIMVQLHHAGGSGTMSVVPPYPTMMTRDGRLLPCNCGGTLRTHPSHVSENRPPSHLYFTLDPEVQVEERAALDRSCPAIEQGGGNESYRTIPRAHQQSDFASPPRLEVNQRALMAPPPSDTNHVDAIEMVPLNLTIPNRSKHANNQIQDNPVPLNLTPPHRKSLSAQQDSNHEGRQDFHPRQNPSAIGVQAHS